MTLYIQSKKQWMCGNHMSESLCGFVFNVAEGHNGCRMTDDS